MSHDSDHRYMKYNRYWQYNFRHYSQYTLYRLSNSKFSYHL